MVLILLSSPPFTSTGMVLILHTHTHTHTHVHRYGVDPAGVGDPLIVQPTLSGAITHGPTAAHTTKVDFVYVENAAAAHTAAAIALLDRPGDVAGLSINVANREPFYGPQVT
jgi:hypothetical protein